MLWQRLARLYRLTALVAFNVLLLLVVFNAALAVYYWRAEKPAAKPPPEPRHRAAHIDPDGYRRTPPELAARYIEEEDRMWNQGLEYAPWLQFRNPAFQGSLLNVDARGHRRTVEPRRPGPDAVRIYAFGGSTTFGYGVPDEHTIPSRLQRLAEEKYPRRSIVVKNLGQPFYFSSQELLLLISLLKEGDAPHWAVFLDGINEVIQLGRQVDEPYYTETVRELWDQRRRARPTPARDWSWVPMVRLARELAPALERWRAHRSPPPPAPALPAARPPPAPEAANRDAERAADYVISRYTANVRLIEAVCREYRIECRFVWQPSPFYASDPGPHRPLPIPGGIPAHFEIVYRRMKDYRHPRFLYLGELFAGGKEKIFVDEVHYNEPASEAIAARILGLLTVTETPAPKRP